VLVAVELVTHRNNSAFFSQPAYIKNMKSLISQREDRRSVLLRLYCDIADRWTDRQTDGQTDAQTGP